MYRAVPIISLSGYIALQALAGGSSAISREADAVHRAASEVRDSAERSFALFGEKASALSDLAAMVSECSEQNWDGDGALAMHPSAVRLVERFVRALPEYLPLPEFSPDPDGSISLDWIQSRNRLFSLSIGRNDRLAYAYLDGTDKGHGVVRFDGQSIPSLVLDAIERVVGRHAGVRAA